MNTVSLYPKFLSKEKYRCKSGIAGRILSLWPLFWAETPTTLHDLCDLCDLACPRLSSILVFLIPWHHHGYPLVPMNTFGCGIRSLYSNGCQMSLQCKFVSRSRNPPQTKLTLPTPKRMKNAENSFLQSSLIPENIINFTCRFSIFIPTWRFLTCDRTGHPSYDWTTWQKWHTFH